MNIDIAKFIFRKQYYFKRIGKSKKKWYKEIFHLFYISTLHNKCANDDFRNTWRELQEIGLLEKKEKFIK